MLPGVFLVLSDDAPVFGPVVIGGHAVVGIHPVGRRPAVGREAPEGEGRIVQLGGVGGGLCHRYGVARTDEEQNLAKFAGQIVPPGGQNFLIVVGDAAQTQHLHPLRQIDRPAMGVLGVDGCDHQALAKKQLVVHLPGVGVGRVSKAKGRK